MKKKVKVKPLFPILVIVFLACLFLGGGGMWYY